MIITFELNLRITPHMKDQLLARSYSSKEEFDKVVENILDDESENVGDIYSWASWSEDTYNKLWEWYKQELKKGL